MRGMVDGLLTAFAISSMRITDSEYSWSKTLEDIVILMCELVEEDVWSYFEAEIGDYRAEKCYPIL